MKPWCVVRYMDEQMSNMRYVNPPRGATYHGVSWAASQDKTDMWAHWDSPYQQLWFVDTEDDAKKLAEELAKKHPEYNYAAAKVGNVFKSTPGPVHQSIFTKDGLLPI